MKTCYSDSFFPAADRRRTARGREKRPPRAARSGRQWRAAEAAPQRRAQRREPPQAAAAGGPASQESAGGLSTPRAARRRRRAKRVDKTGRANQRSGGLSAERKRERTRELNAPVARCETHVRDTEARESDSPRKRGREATRKRDAEAARQTCKQSSSAQAGIHCFVWWNRATPERDCICISSVSQGR